jgi:hypothetical protein
MVQNFPCKWHCSTRIKIFNNLPHNIKDLANKIIPFWNASKMFLLTNSFYNSEEYFVRDNLLKTDRKIKDGFWCLIIYILLLTLYYVRLYVCWLCLYPQDCILHWIYGMQINCITFLHLQQGKFQHHPQQSSIQHSLLPLPSTYYPCNWYTWDPFITIHPSVSRSSKCLFSKNHLWC